MTRLLLVEDNEMNRDALSRLLARHGFEVEAVEDGEQAVKRVQEAPPDIVLMDISLPVMDGYEATRRIRALEGTGAIPIIALTAHAFAQDREMALAAGCTAFETKPVELPRLLAKIRTCLDGSAP